MSDNQLQTKMINGMMMKDGHQLQEYLSAKDIDTINTLFQKATGISLLMVTGYKPFILTSMLYPSVLGCNPIAFEIEFVKLAKKDAITVKGLETIEDQLNILDTIPYKVQAEIFAEGLLQFDKSKKELQDLIILYKQKDLFAMHTSILSDKEFGKYDELLLNNRNQNWLPIIKTAVDSTSSFIAVGAQGHLGGDNGVLSPIEKMRLYTYSCLLLKDLLKLCLSSPTCIKPHVGSRFSHSSL